MDRSEKNVLLVSLENLDNGIQYQYYCSNNEGEPKFCNSIMSAEVTTKYILSKVKIDEIIVIGSGATYDEGDDLRKASLHEGESYLVPDISILSEYGLYKYRIFEYLEGMDLEEHDILEGIPSEDKERLIDAFNKFHREVGQRSPRKKKKDVFFRTLSREPELFEELVQRLPDDLKDKTDWLKRYIYSIMSDFYKFRALEANEDVVISFVPTVKSKEGSIDPNNITKIMDLLSSSEGEAVNLYVDMQGLVRTDDFAMVTVLSILQNEWKTRIKVKEILATSFSGFTYEIKNENARYELNDLLAGMNAFIQYGKVGSLRKYWDDLDIFDEHVEKMLFAMQYIDDGVSLCNIEDLEFGIKELRTVLSEENSNTEKSLESNVIGILEAGIKRDFGVLLDVDEEGSIDVLELIKWAYRKEFYQQVLTIMESRIPNDFVKRGILYYAESEQDKEQATEILAREYRSARPRDRYQFNDIDHYFVKFYGRSQINFRQNPKKVQQEYAKYRIEQIGKDDPAFLKTYSVLEDDMHLEELLFSYYSIGPIRNQVSHGRSETRVYPGQRKLRKENNNIRGLKDATDHFIQQYDAAKEKIKDKKPAVVTITNEELKAKAYERNNSGKGRMDRSGKKPHNDR